MTVPMAVRMRYAHFLASREQREVRSLTPMLATWKHITRTQSVLDDIARGHMIVFKDGILPPYTGIRPTRPELFGVEQARTLDEELASLLAKRSVEVCSTAPLTRRIFQPSLSGPQVRGGPQAFSQSETLQQVCREGDIQNVAYTNPTVHYEEERLDGVCGPSRCLPTRSDCGMSQEVVSIQLKRGRATSAPDSPSATAFPQSASRAA